MKRVPKLDLRARKCAVNWGPEDDAAVAEKVCSGWKRGDAVRAILSDLEYEATRPVDPGFSPAPWTLGLRHGDFVDIDSGARPHGVKWHAFAQVVVIHDGMSSAAGEANAALICASPKLYAALERLRAAGDSFGALWGSSESNGETWNTPGAQDRRFDALCGALEQARTALSEARGGM